MTASELLATIEDGQDVYRCELRTYASGQIDRQWFLNGVPVHDGPRLRNSERCASLKTVGSV
jgi:hypothetical protein